MSHEANPFPERVGANVDFLTTAIAMVQTYIESKLDASDEKPAYEVYIVWFSRTIQNWKALVSSTLPDQMYYEVTYNGDKNETYLDAYKKLENIVAEL